MRESYFNILLEKVENYMETLLMYIYNVHSLVHICEDSLFYECSLDAISTFPFENHLQMFTKFILKPQNPLSQIVKRIEELDKHCSCLLYTSPSPRDS